MAVWSWNAAVATVCGDPVIWKPSEHTPLCSVAVQNIANRVMDDHGVSGVFNLLVGGGELGAALADRDRRLPLISFTGSTRVGRKVATEVAGRLGRVPPRARLGNNAVVVSRNADLDLAVTGHRLRFGGHHRTARCTTTRRVLADREVAGPLVERLVDAYRQVPIGNPARSGHPHGTADLGRRRRRDAGRAGARGCGRSRYRTSSAAAVGVPTSGRTMSSRPSCECPRRRRWWPRKPSPPSFTSWKPESLEAAIALHNDVPQGLSSAIFTDSLREAETFLSARGSDCGIANVNIGTSGAEIGGAFGGEKDTGGGRESGSDAWKAYMRRQTNTINWSKDLPLAQGIEFGPAASEGEA